MKNIFRLYFFFTDFTQAQDFKMGTSNLTLELHDYRFKLSCEETNMLPD